MRKLCEVLAVIAYILSMVVFLGDMPETLAMAGPVEEAEEQTAKGGTSEAWYSIDEEGVLTISLANDVSSYSWNYGLSNDDILEYLPGPSHTVKKKGQKWTVCFRGGAPGDAFLNVYYVKNSEEAPAEKRVLKVHVDEMCVINVVE